MFETPIILMHQWAPVLLAAALPFWLGAIAMIAQQYRKPAADELRHLPKTAGTWLQQQMRSEAPDIGLHTHKHTGVDAFWPGVEEIGLCRQTHEGRTVLQRAIAAHELGHAVNFGTHWTLPHILPAARLVETLSWRGYGAALFVVAWMGLETAVIPMVAFLWIACAATAIVLADEGMASIRAMSWLSEDLDLRDRDREMARQTLVQGWSLYASRGFGQIALLFCLPWLVPHLAGARTSATLAEPGDIAVWLGIAAAPFLILRAIQVLVQIWRPDPVNSDFRLFSVMERDGQWESISAMAVLIVVMGQYNQVSGPAFAISVALAATVALGPLSALGRALVLLPMLLGLRRITTRTVQDDRALFPEASPDGAVPALMALYNNPPWYLRASWLARLAYVPMLVALAVDFIGI